MIKKKCVSDYVLLSTVYSSHNTLRCNLFLDLCTVCSLFLKWKLLIFVSLLISWLLLQSFLCSLFVFSVFFFNLFFKDFLFFLIWTISKVFINLLQYSFCFMFWPLLAVRHVGFQLPDQGSNPHPLHWKAKS